MSAIEFSTVGVRTMADGTLRVSVDIEPRHARDAFQLFGAPGTPGAMTALKTAAQKEEKPKGGSASKWLAMRCAEPEFQEWLANNWGKSWMANDYVDDAKEQAALVVRHLCGIISRAEIDNDPAAMDRFERLIRKPWMARSQNASNRNIERTTA